MSKLKIIVEIDDAIGIRSNVDPIEMAEELTVAWPEAEVLDAEWIEETDER